MLHVYAPSTSANLNIVVRALARVREVSGRREPVALELFKGMPVGSGLGSNAAFKGAPGIRVVGHRCIVPIVPARYMVIVG